MQLGLPVPQTETMPAAAGPAAPSPSPIDSMVAGAMPAMSLGATLARDEEAEASATLAKQLAQPHITALATHIKKCFRVAEDARRSSGVDDRMLEAMLARRGEYTAAKKQLIKENRQPEIYMMLAAAKMRQIEALIRDVLIGTGAEKPWTLKPTPVPELPVEIAQQIAQALKQQVMQALMMGVYPSQEEVRQRLRVMRDQVDGQLREEARIRAERMEQKIEDQLVEGGFMTTLDSFVTDLATYPTAFVKGPVVRKKPKLTWGEGGTLVVEEKLVREWERLDPFNAYPAPHAKHIQDAWFIEKAYYTRDALSGLIGVEGWDEDAIRAVLTRYGDRGLHERESFETQKLEAEGKSTSYQNETGLIDGYVYWGTASGKMLQQWGMSRKLVPDAAKEYPIEAVLVGDYVIRAVLNADPLARRPYRATSFQKQPGTLWGHSPYDLIKDCQDMCNATARALAANMAISSGPMVAVYVDLLPDGADVSELAPWKMFQFVSDPMGGSRKPMEFFQPESNANELMTVYERFSLLADEYTGIPRYMAGFNGGEGGAGRTASGISMMIGNASKTIKQVLGTIDFDIIVPSIEAAHYYNMRYEDDPELKGDIQIVARGAMSLTTKEQAQVRTNEFLAATANPVDMQIIGIPGRAELLRHAVKRLDIPAPDKVVPPIQVIQERMAMQAMQAAQAGAPQPGGPEGQGGTPENPEKNGQKLENGAPVTDNYSPTPA